VLTGPGSCGAFRMLENGVPIRPVGFCNVNEMFEINTEQADSIEILRGPSNSLYGSSAVHDAVNVRVAAACAQAAWQMSPRWSLAAGLRAEYVRYDYDNRMLAGNTDENGVPAPPGACTAGQMIVPTASMHSRRSWRCRSRSDYFPGRDRTLFVELSWQR
jgi:outer membrane receptor protein involved in Fe transport